MQKWPVSEWAKEAIEQPIEVLAEKKYRYRKYRAFATGDYWGRRDFIDEPAKADYERITGVKIEVRNPFPKRR